MPHKGHIQSEETKAQTKKCQNYNYGPHVRRREALKLFNSSNDIDEKCNIVSQLVLSYLPDKMIVQCDACSTISPIQHKCSLCGTDLKRVITIKMQQDAKPSTINAANIKEVKEIVECPGCHEEMPKTLYCLNCGFPLFQDELRKKKSDTVK